LGQHFVAKDYGLVPSIIRRRGQPDFATSVSNHEANNGRQFGANLQNLSPFLRGILRQVAVRHNPGKVVCFVESQGEMSDGRFFFGRR
jgi:hypothetical protein